MPHPTPCARHASIIAPRPLCFTRRVAPVMSHPSCFTSRLAPAMLHSSRCARYDYCPQKPHGLQNLKWGNEGDRRTSCDSLRRSLSNRWRLSPSARTSATKMETETPANRTRTVASATLRPARLLPKDALPTKTKSDEPPQFVAIGLLQPLAPVLPYPLPRNAETTGKVVNTYRFFGTPINRTKHVAPVILRPS